MITAISTSNTNAKTESATDNINCLPELNRENDIQIEVGGNYLFVVYTLENSSENGYWQRAIRAIPLELIKNGPFQNCQP
jgi:hypothetical protein